MKKLLTIILSLLIINISSAQSGWGYVNYTSYKTHAGSGATNQYGPFPYSAAEFDNMLNTSNSNTTITNTGEVPISYLYYGSLQTPHWNSDFFAFKFDFWFIPKVTGTYYFGTNSDDASDILIDGTVIATYYGGHGASGYRTGQLNMIAGQRYKVVYRGQEYGGGEAFYFRWYRPGLGWGYWNDEVTNISSTPTKQARMNFDFGSTLDKTKFSIGLSLSSTGWIDVTNELDSNKVANGNYKMTFTPGQVEWVWTKALPTDRYGYVPTEMGVDLRKFNGIDPSKVTSIKYLDAYEGDMTYTSSDIYWARYNVLSPNNLSVLFGTETNGYVGTSQYLSSIRNMGGGYMWGVKVEPSLTEIQSYKTQKVLMTTTNTLSTLYNSIVTVSDVYLAFKELANGGLFGNQTGNEFVYGIQYKNADVNDDGVFNESDCFVLLQHLTGQKNLVDTFNLRKTLKLIPQSTYSNIGKSNWNTFPSFLGDTISFDINTGKSIDTLNLIGTWKGDVNLSHSGTPPSNGITTMSLRSMSTIISNEINTSIISEIVNDKVEFILSIDPLQQELVGTQFQLNYDKSVLKFEKVEFKTKGNPTNFGTDKGDNINFGSLISDGSTTLDNTTEYKITFSILNGTKDILGLTSVSLTDAVNKSGKQLKVNVK